MATSHHAEHVGSLLRPPEVLAARRARAAGRMTTEQLREAEDRAALEVIELQRQAGIEVFTDGEVRRQNWMASLLEELGGVVPGPNVDANVTWLRGSGEQPPLDETHFDTVAVAEKVYLKNPLTGVEAAFMARHAPGRYKITMMSASMAGLLWCPGVSDEAYATPDDMARDVLDVQAREIEGLVDQGVTWIQLDSLNYNWIIDTEARERRGVGGGAQVSELLERFVQADNQLVRAARKKNPGLTVGLHFCRGNNRSAWFARGGYEPVAERLFGGVDVDRFLLEYDTGRAGGFEPLRFVPRGKTVVLGLVSSKVSQLESQDELRRRIDEAAGYVPIEDLALSPQCGFASTAPGNLLTVDEERRKLELVVETARKVWG